MTQEEKAYLSRMEALCKQLNSLIPIKNEEDRDKLNALIADMCNSRFEYSHYGLYWDRDVFIKSGCDEKIREAVLHGDFLKFEPNEEFEEHPGVVVRLKEWAVHYKNE